MPGFSHGIWPMLDRVASAIVKLAAACAVLGAVAGVAVPSWWAWRGNEMLDNMGVARVADIDARLGRIENMLAAGASRMDDLTARVSRLSGDDRVIRMPAGLSFVREPVYRGDPVEIVVVAQRTAGGMNCVLTSAFPVFQDITGLTVGGPPVPPVPQLAQEVQSLLVTATPHDWGALVAGRIMVTLALQYDCAGQTRVDATDPVFFTLLDRPRYDPRPPPGGPWPP